MAAWALRAIGADPAFFIGGEVPGLGEGGETANAGWGEGEWVVAEADESDGSFLELKPEVAVITNVEMDHHSHWGSIAELRAAFERFAAGAPARRVRRRLARARRSSRLAVPGHHNLLNARAALAAVGLAGADVEAAAAGAGRTSPGCGGGWSARARPAAPSSTTTTPTTRPSCGRRWRRCASSAASG